MVHVVMPQFGETVTEGELTRWLVSVGDVVAIDQPIAEISTDKVDTEVVASSAGTVSALLADVGAIVGVGEPLLEIGEPATSPAQQVPVTVAPVEHAAPSRSGTEGLATRPRSTPKARRLASERGIDITLLSSESGTIRAADVPTTANASALVPPAVAPLAAPAGTYLVQHSRVRQITARRTRESLSAAATAWSVTEVDYTGVDRSRKSLTGAWKARYGTSLTYLPYVLRSVSLALVDYPHLNAEYQAEGLLVSEAVHLGVAVDLGAGGLIVPVIRDAESLSVASTALALQALAGSARSGTLKADSLAGSTFAVTNNGSYGSVLTMPIINQPHVGILSFDAVTPRPSVVALDDGSLGIAVRMKGALALSWDHRAIDGAYAAKFLTHVKTLLETTSWDVALPS